MNRKWHNWSRSVSANPEYILFPETEKELCSILKKAKEKEKTIRILGAGHSFTPLAKCKDWMISLDKFSGIISINEKALTAQIWAGTRIRTLTKELFKKGYCLENQGAIDEQSIVGALSTGTHGSGIKFGIMSTQLKSMTLLLASGEFVKCSLNNNVELFKAAQLSLGCLGIITRIELKLQKAIKLKFESKKKSFTSVINQMSEISKVNRNYEFYWFPFTEIVQVKYLNETCEEYRRSNLAKWCKDIFFENGLYFLLSRISYFLPSTSKLISKIIAKIAKEETKIIWSHQVSDIPRYVKFQEMEYSVPLESAKEVMQEIKNAMENEKFNVSFPIECRWVKSDDIWLSPAFGRDSAYIAIHMYYGKSYTKFFKHIEKIFVKYNGRPHWGKIHNQKSLYFCKMYSKWEDFKLLRERIDPTGIFMNSYTKDLFNQRLE